ncbi:hypothetical protein B0H21DRAFT_819881 [Amylocystis lapponica]|nr:hypothetical protein B0H21DRAFT_819881 [Amylocystis lapponica]
MESVHSVVFLPELWDRTIDFLWAHTTTLVACSLTCRMWASSSRFHLFRWASLATRKDLRRLEKLLKLSEAASTGIVHYIRELNISSNCLEELRTKREIRPFRLSSLLAKLVATKIFTLEGDLSKGPSSASHCDLLYSIVHSPLPFTITALVLGGCDLKDGNHIINLLCAFPRLTSLELRIPSSSGPTLSTNQHYRAALDELTIDSNHRFNVVLAQWILNTVPDIRLRTLHWFGLFDDPTGLQQHVLVDLVQRTASSLQHVRLSLDLSRQDAQDLTDLSACTHLVSLEVAVTGIDSTFVLPALLSQLRSPFLRNLTVLLDSSYHEHERVLSSAAFWTPLDSVLAHMEPKLPELVVTFHCYCIFVNEVRVSEMFDVMSDSFSQSYASGLRPFVKCSEKRLDGMYMTRLLG